MRKINLLVAACALVLGMSEIGAMIQQSSLTPENRNRMIQSLESRMYETQYSDISAWDEIFSEAANAGILREVLLSQRFGGNAINNALVSRSAFPRINWIGLADADAAAVREVFHSDIVKTAISMGHTDDNILSWVNVARSLGVLNVALGSDGHVGSKTALDVAIAKYRSEDLVRKIVRLAGQVPGLLQQLINGALVQNAEAIQSPAANYLRQVYTRLSVDATADISDL